MFGNYLKVAFRNIKKYKGYTFINVTGLAIGLACCLLISLWILDELNYDKQYPDVENIYSVLFNEEPYTPNALAPYLQEAAPEVEFAARTASKRKLLVSSSSLQSYEEIFIVDPSIIDVFSFEFISGNPQYAFNAINSIVLTQHTATKFFPEGDAVDQTLLIDKDEFIVTGVVENQPHNSSLQFDMLRSIDYDSQLSGDDEKYYGAWKAVGTRTYIKTKPGTNLAALTEKYTNLIQEYFKEDQEAKLSAINISELYFKFSNTKKGVTIFSGIALAILIMACINFINLSTARSSKRAKETGMRKIIGANRGELIAQFLGESFLLTMIGFIIAILIVQLVLPVFNTFFNLHLSLGVLNSGIFILLASGILILTAIAAGIYPAILLSRFNPIQAIKGESETGHRKFNLRRILVVIQFAMAVFLIAGTAVIYTQINHIKSWDIGYNKEHVLTIDLKGEGRDHFHVLKNEFLKNPEILSVAGSVRSLPYWSMYTTAKWDGLKNEDGEDVSMNFSGYDFAKTYGITMIEGRDFDKEHTTDLKQGCIVNESLAKLMSQDQSLGANIDIWGSEKKIIGVFKDFNFLPLEEKIEPLAVMMVNDDNFAFTKMRILAARISPNNIASSLEHMRESWKIVLPDHPFEYSFVDEQFDANYKSIEQIRNLAGSFGVLAIFIACLGLFGLASFSAEQRTKEIGIRKVLGASIRNIVGLLSKEFMILVLIANLIAWPISWIIMHRWLQEFAYHVEIELAIFFIAGFFALIIALISVGFQAIRAARANPVDAMKYE
ncbi:MAG: ABC transporter permease [candidate division Zixibacteria bacterium]